MGSFTFEEYQADLDQIRKTHRCVSCGTCWGETDKPPYLNQAGEPCCSDTCRIQSNVRIDKEFAGMEEAIGEWPPDIL